MPSARSPKGPTLRGFDPEDDPPSSENLMEDVSMTLTRGLHVAAAALVIAVIVSASRHTSASPGGPSGSHDLAGRPPYGPPPPPPDPVMGMGGMVLRQMNLDPDQRQQVRAIVRKAVEGHLGDLARAFGEARHALEMKVWDPRSTEQDMIVASGMVSERVAALESARRQLARDVLAVLTEEQRDAFFERLAADPGPPPPPR